MTRSLISATRFPAILSIVLLLCASGGSALAQDQDLVALAKKERARRAKIAKPSKVLTEEDGKAALESGAGSLTTVEKADITSTPQSTPQEGADSQANEEAAWRTRATSVRSAVTTAESTLQGLEKELATVSADVAPLSAAEAQDPLRLQKKTQRIAELNQQIAAQKEAVAEARRAVAAFEEEARSNGVPPGWLR